MGAAMATGTCTGDAAIITAGTEVAVTTSTAIIITDRFSLDSRSPPHCPGEREWQRFERVAPSSAAGSAGIERTASSARSAELHLHRDPDQIRMVLGAELLLEQRGGVGHRLVGNFQRIGDFDDLVAAAQ